MLQTQASKLEHPTHEKQAAAKKIPNKCEKKPAITAWSNIRKPSLRDWGITILGCIQDSALILLSAGTGLDFLRFP